ncbi:MAG: E3 ubiquitin ligase family protein [Gammaproteobacteria bacterium]|nr:E3 ubiquitin ligase family protein [Gammaproteobacteria bacterium]
MRSEILAATPGVFWLAEGLALGLMLVALYIGFHYLRRARYIEDIPTSRIRSAHQGYVEIVGMGEALDGQPILAPLSRRQCLWYRFTVQERPVSASGRERSVGWRSLHSGQSDGIFAIRDGTGECIVDPEGADVTTTHTRRWTGNSPWPEFTPEESDSLLDRFLGGLFSMGMETYRYTESLLLPGETVYALGTFRTQGTGYQTDVKEEISATLRAWKRDPQRMRSFDADGDGRVDIQEWERARSAARQQVMIERVRRREVLVTHVMKNPKDSGLPYLLSAESEFGLVRRYRAWGGLGTTTFLVVFVLAAWALGVRLDFP